jgi:hypothetical protein
MNGTSQTNASFQGSKKSGLDRNCVLSQHKRCVQRELNDTTESTATGSPKADSLLEPLLKMMTHCYEFPIRILLSQEDGEFVAHALELDLVAYGKTEKAAVLELRDTMHAQMSYASQVNQPELVIHPAPEDYFKRWEEAHQAALRGVISKDLPRQMLTKATFITVDPQEIQSPRQANVFKRVANVPLAKTA